MATIKTVQQKVILCGEYGVGKSSLFRRFMANTFVNSSDRKSTLGLDHFIKTFNVNDRDMSICLFDTAGMERIASVTSSYYKFAEAAILVFDCNSDESFHLLSQHILEIVSYAENAKIFLCSNKSDLTNMVSDEDIENFCQQCQIIQSPVFKTSCKNGTGVQEMFTEISRRLADTNRSRRELSLLESGHSFQVQPTQAEEVVDSCIC